MEQWRPVKGFDGRYEVSDKGNVRSFCVIGSNSKRVDMDNPMMLRQYDNGHGYKCVRIRVDGHVKAFYIHRLVAEAFILNPQNLPCINHKDEDKANNCIDNLEWCTHKYNQNYGTIRQRISEKNKGKVSPMLGRHPSDETREKLRLSHIGKKASLETRRKLSDLNKGEKNHMYGKHLSDEAKDRIREKNRIRFSGDKNPMYGKNAYAGKTPEELAVIADKKRETFRRKREAKQEETKNEQR